MCIYIYTHICMCMYINTHTYTNTRARLLHELRHGDPLVPILVQLLEARRDYYIMSCIIVYCMLSCYVIVSYYSMLCHSIVYCIILCYSLA